MLRGDTVRLQPWFIIRRVSWLYIVACTNGCHKEYKGDWLHRGLLHFFRRQEILIWNLVFIILGGHFNLRYVISMGHIVQSSVKVRAGIQSKVHWECKMEFSSFPRWSQLGLFLSSFSHYAILWTPWTWFVELKVYIFWPLFSISTFPQTLAATMLLYAPNSLIILGCTYYWQNEHLSFCIWLLSLILMSSRFICVVANGRVSFLFKTE